jgi:hypothetical protein
MKLRDHPDLNWPPSNWSGSGSPLPTDLNSIILGAVEQTFGIGNPARADGVRLETTHQGNVWHHKYEIADPARAQNLYKTLKGSIRQTMGQIGAREIDNDFNLV